jgi:hypothetical protein
MLSDYRPHYKAKRSASNKNGRWTDSQKLDAAKLYLITGSPSATAAALNIPLDTIKYWRYSNWWKKLLEDLRSENQIQLSAKLKKIAEKSLDITLERLENGDFQYDPKSGELIRKPVLMRDAHRVAADLLDRHLDLEKRPFEEEAQKATQDRLEALAKTFADFTKKVRKIEVMDASYTGTPDKAIEGTWREKPEGISLQTSEQDGSHEGEQADFEREEKELNVSGREGEGSSSEV